jgi:hypothetical protein
MRNCYQSCYFLPDSGAVARYAKYLGIVAAVVVVSACSPSDRTPGQWLRGNVVDTVPQDWTFTDEFKEIYVEVKTPYFIPHSVTIWCGQVDGKLFIGVRDPETKNWPGWMDKNRDVRLKIGDDIYSVAASDLSDEETLAKVRSAYAKKYDLPTATNDKPRKVRYWSIITRRG